MEFYSTQKLELAQFLDNDINVRSVIVIGSIGLGKSRIIKDVTSHLDFIKITFEKTFRPPFDYIIQGLSMNSHNGKREEIITELSQAYIHKDCVIYENFEYCDKDSIELIKQVIQFHIENKQSAISIIEWNCDYEIKDKDLNHALWITFQKLTDDELEKYIKTIIKKKNEKQFTYICRQLTQVANGNLLALQLGINILLQQRILEKSSTDSKYIYSGGEVPGNLFLLYLKLFKALDTHLQEALRIIAPFESEIYVPILKDAFTHCKMLDIYLDEISKYESFIFSKQVSGDGYDLKTYIFMTEEAKAAVTESTPSDTFHAITTQLYQNLENLYKRIISINSINKNESIYLLTLLIKIRNNQLTINHLPYFVTLMQYYNDHSSYRAVIHLSKQFLEVNVLSPIQINIEQPAFFRLYFHALLAIGEYDAVISYFNQFSDWDIQLLIAYAYYNSGNPRQALTLCEELEMQHSKGEIYSLKASIYDWLGDNKLATDNFKKALRFTVDNDELKYSLLKKYSLYIDFDLPECKEKMKEALQYYQNTSARQYAETLHNYGTNSILSFDDANLSFLEKSQEILLSLCEKEVYYPENSIAIYHCLHNDYTTAIKIWESIDVRYIPIKFCKLAIQNNLFCAYIKNNNLDLAENMRVKLTQQLNYLDLKSNVKQISTQHPDIQHQVRQYFLNCALLDLARHNQDSALHFFMSALECSKYHSTMLYLIQNKIYDLQKNVHTTILDILYNKIREKKLGHPGKLANFFAENQMYFCIIMFWGDY